MAGDPSELGAATPSRHDEVWPGEHGQHRDQLVVGGGGPLGDEQREHPEHGTAREPQRHEGQRPQSAVDQQRVDGVAPIDATGSATDRVEAAHAAQARLGMEDHRVGAGEHPVAGPDHPPAEVDVVAEQAEPLVETTQAFEDVATYQHARGADGEDVAHDVVLALVELAEFQTRLAVAAAGDGHAELEQPAAVGPVPQLGAEDRRRRHHVAQPQQGVQCLGSRSAVVVQEPEPLARLAGRQRPDRAGHGGTEARPSGGASRTRPAPKVASNWSREPSRLPVSTATTRSGARCWLRSPAMSSENHCAPL